ncbi:MAG: hypothetical protein ACUVR4_05925 [Anaerolineae bacterium]
MQDYSGSHPFLTLARIARTWWPLAASWLLMGAELPVLSAVVARLPEPEVNLAAYGGVVFPLALIIESPVIMLLAASTALSKDWASYRKLWTYMMAAGGILTALHVLVAFTPLYYVVARGILGVPEAIVEPARVGLMIMTPWTWAIAYRRFNQGVLIRFGHSRSVGMGTVVRLTADLAVLLFGLAAGTIPGIVVATAAVAAGVVSEAVFAGRRVRPVLQYKLKAQPPVEPPLTYAAFFAFYIPLVFTSLLTLLAQPIGSAALSRMPQALASLAAWPVVTGLVFMARGLGIAFNEVVVALLDEPGARPALRRFTLLLAAGTSAVLALVAATPLSQLWFQRVSALSPELAEMARLGLWVALPMPALSALQSWYQGAILHSRRTRGITESVAIFLAASAVVLTAGVAWGGVTGLYVGLAGMVIATLAQTIWLWWRARPAL